MEKKTFQVPAIGCQGCVNTIVSELNDITGVEHVEGNMDTRMVTVEWDSPATWDRIKAALVEIEYPPAEVAV